MTAPATPDGTLRDRLVTTGRGLFALAIVVAVLLLLRRMKWDARPGGALFALGFLLLAGTVGGRVAAFLGFPRLTGYLAVGVLAGPHGLPLFGSDDGDAATLITQDDVQALTLVNGLALALIALQAGAELTIPMLRRSLKSLLMASLGHILFIFFGMTALFVALAPFMGFMKGLAMPAVIAVGAVWGAMAVSKAATDTIAILSETKAKGPVSEYVLGVVIFLDVVVLILFAVALGWARSSVAGGAFSVDDLVHLGQEIFASVAAGTTFGLVIAFYFWAIGREKLLFTVAVAYGVTAFTHYFHYDTLLVFVVAGFVVMNLTREGPDLVHTIERAFTAVMVVFFATAGAQLDIRALKTAGLIALALAFGRIALTYAGSRLGHRLARDSEPVRRYGFTGFISQAGVTLGLAAIAREELPEVGAGLATMLIAVIGINELVGPIAFKIGLSRAGEIGRGGDFFAPDDDGGTSKKPEQPGSRGRSRPVATAEAGGCGEGARVVDAERVRAALEVEGVLLGTAAVRIPANARRVALRTSSLVCGFHPMDHCKSTRRTNE